MPREKRRATRGQVSATLVLLDNEQPISSHRVLNLSVGGALLVGRPPKVRPADLEVIVRLSTGRTIRSRAVIVREESVGENSVFAVELIRLSPDDLDAIDNLLLTSVDDERDPTALVVGSAPEILRLLRRRLSGLGHPSFGVSNREDVMRFLEAPNRVSVALVDLALEPAEAQAVLTYLAQKHPEIRRIAIAELARPTSAAPRARQAHALAHEVVPSPWTRESLEAALKS